MRDSSSSYSSSESSRVSQFESWGYTVTPIWDGDSQANFDTALVSAEVVYVPVTVDGDSVAYKLRTATVGVVQEAVRYWDDEMGWTSDTGWTTSKMDEIDIENNSHEITSGFPTGDLTVFSSWFDAVIAEVRGASAGTELAGDEWFGDPVLKVLEAGEALGNTYNGNSTASGRRVRLPYSASSFEAFDWSDLTADGLTLIENSLSWASGGSGGGSGGGGGGGGGGGSSTLSILMTVVDSGSLTSEESTRQSQFEGWGYSVTVIDDSDSQANYDTAFASHDVVYVPEDVSTSALGDKLREAPIGVVYEDETLDDSLGLSTSNGSEDWSLIIAVNDNSHEITTGLSTGPVAIFSSAEPLSLMNANYASGLQVLASGSFGEPALAIVETGATLANTINSNSTAAGRRVHLPWGGDSFNWSSLDGDGLLIAQQAIEWAAAGAGLVGHWKLDETSGATAADSSESGRDGTYENGVTLGQSGVRGYAASFDGVDDSVTVGDYPEHDITDAITIAAWVKLNALSGTPQFLVAKGGAEAYRFRVNPSGNASIDLFGASGQETPGATVLPTGRWVHLVGWYDGTTARVYLNGVVDGEEASTGAINTTSNSLTIGKRHDDTLYLDGELDDVRIYDRALSDTEIAALYGLMGHWKFDEGSGTTVADATGNGYDGAFDDGTPAWVTGVRGAALEFDGTNDVETAVDFDPPETGSLAFWLKPTGALGNRVLGSADNWEIRTGASGSVECDLAGPDGGVFGSGNDSIEQGRWTHVVAIYDTISDTYQMYLDGALSVSGAYTCADQEPGVLSFGTRTGTADRFIGVIDDIRIYDRVLTDYEVAGLYGLVGWYRMEEGAGSGVADSSGAGNDGSLAGSAGWSADAKEGSGSLDLDGADYVEVPGLVVDDGTDGVTIAGWANLSSADTDGSIVATVGSYFTIRMLQSGVRATAYDGSSWTSATWGANLEGAGWRHVAAVYDGVSYDIGLYVDGVLRATANLGAPIDFTGQGSTTRIGEHANGVAGRTFTGQVDDIRVYNRAATPDEVRALFYGEITPGLRIVEWLEVANP